MYWKVNVVSQYLEKILNYEKQRKIKRNTL